MCEGEALGDYRDWKMIDGKIKHTLGNMLFKE